MTDVDRLRAWMEYERYTQRQLADRMGMSESMISRILHGRRSISGHFKWKFYFMFGKRAADSIFEEEERNGTHGSS